jgi:hypothetical protein
MISPLQNQTAQWVLPPAIGQGSARYYASNNQTNDTGSSAETSRTLLALAKQQSSKNASQNANGQLTPEQQEQIDQLKARDAEVRAHEQAHLTAAGSYATSGAHYYYQKGPDGRSYAIGGEVSIDVSPVPNDPEATMRKMDVVQQAALAPSDPSDQDLKVARAAAQTRLQAATETQTQQQPNQVEAGESSKSEASRSNKQEAADSDSNHRSSVEQKPSWFSQRVDNGYQQSQTNSNSIGYSVYA